MFFPPDLQRAVGRLSQYLSILCDGHGIGAVGTSVVGAVGRGVGDPVGSAVGASDGVTVGLDEGAEV